VGSAHHFLKNAYLNKTLTKIIYLVILNGVKDLNLFNNMRFFALLRMTISHARDFILTLNNVGFAFFCLKLIAYSLQLTAYSLQPLLIRLLLGLLRQPLPDADGEIRAVQFAPAAAGAAFGFDHHRGPLLVQCQALPGTEGGAQAAFFAPGPVNVNVVFLVRGRLRRRRGLRGGSRLRRSWRR
jgi:hypothetical protein